MQNVHFKNLDSLRGLAALTVVFSHVCLITSYAWIDRSPLRLLQAGHEAVILFFILSGFVLSLQLERADIPYHQYALRRIARIYLPYIAVVMIAIGIKIITKPVDLTWAGTWWQPFWTAPITPKLLASHLILLAPFQSADIDGVIWSLIYEMRISFLMPLIYFFVARTNWIIALLSALALTGISMIFQHKATLGTEEVSLLGSWSMTAHYTAMFVLGTMLAQYRQWILAMVERYHSATILPIVSLILYSGAIPFAARIHHEGFPADWLIAIGASGLLVSTFSKSFFGKFTGLAIPRFLGKISFSLYLTHLVVFLAVFRLSEGHLSHGFTIALACICSFPVAWLCYIWIERPSIQLSRSFTQKREQMVSVSQ